MRESSMGCGARWCLSSSPRRFVLGRQQANPRVISRRTGVVERVEPMVLPTDPLPACEEALAWDKLLELRLGSEMPGQCEMFLGSPGIESESTGSA